MIERSQTMWRSEKEGERGGAVREEWVRGQEARRQGSSWQCCLSGSWHHQLGTGLYRCGAETHHARDIHPGCLSAMLPVCPKPGTHPGHPIPCQGRSPGSGHGVERCNVHVMLIGFVNRETSNAHPEKCNDKFSFASNSR